MNIFRPQNEDTTLSIPKMVLFVVVAGLVIGSFFLQIGMGICPVPP